MVMFIYDYGISVSIKPWRFCIVCEYICAEIELGREREEKYDNNNKIGLSVVSSTNKDSEN